MIDPGDAFAAPPEPAGDRWPYLTAEAGDVPGVIRLRWEDFRVDEIPAYAPSGEGDHLFLRIEKKGLTTFQAVRDVARALGVDARAIGTAGLKDARAVTTQTLSVEHIDPERVLRLELPRIRVLDAARNRRKLRMGHLAGNRFEIRLRPPEALPSSHGAPTGPRESGNTDRPERASAILEILALRGVPNYFGPQRFGIRGDTGHIGRAVLAGQWQEAAERIAGRPHPSDAEDLRRARELFAERRYAEAAGAWPRGFGEASRLCATLARTGGDARRAVRAVGRRMLSFYVSAYQSWLFNDVLARRLAELDGVRTGDIAEKHDGGALFRVEDGPAEAPRAARFEISATGPLFGGRMLRPHGDPLALERAVLEAAGGDAEALFEAGPFAPPGGRRALRARLGDPAVGSGADDLGPYVELCFTLPPGAYATSVLREVCKEGLMTATAEDYEGVDGPSG